MLLIEEADIMAERIDLFDSTYSHFTKQVLETIRKETFGRDIGQNSWTTVDEYDQSLSWLDLRSEHHVFEVASGSGGRRFTSPITQAAKSPASMLTRRESLQSIRVRRSQSKLIA
jgi:hypothetical protein